MRFRPASGETELPSQSHNGRVDLLGHALGEDTRRAIGSRGRPDDFNVLRAFSEQQWCDDEKLI